MLDLETYKNYIKSYLIENKNYFLVSAILFFMFFFLYFYFFSYVSLPLEDKILTDLKWYVSKFSMNNSILLAFQIWWNNSFIVFLWLISWFFFSFLALIIIFANSALLWLILARSIESVWIWHSLLLLLPHGIVEIPVVLIGMWLAFKLTILIFRKIFRFKTTKFLFETKNVFKFYFLFILPMLLIAAIVEVFVTASL